MRVTVHLDSFNRTGPSAYAIVWLDKEAGKWSREGHAGVSLPEWGRFDTEGGNTRLRAADDLRVLGVLEDLDLGTPSGPYEGEEGGVQWREGEPAAPVDGRWHVQWVDDSVPAPEFGLFADEGS